MCPVCATRTKKKVSLAALSKQTTVKSDFKVSVVSEENRFRTVESKLHFSKGLKYRHNQKGYRKKHLSNQEF